MSGTECSLFAPGWCFTAPVFAPGAPESAAALPWGAGQLQKCVTAAVLLQQVCVSLFLHVPVTRAPPGQQGVVLTGWQQKRLATRLLAALWSSASCCLQIWKSSLSKKSLSSIWSKLGVTEEKVGKWLVTVDCVHRSVQKPRSAWK